MSASSRMPLAFLGSSALAVVVAALALGRDDVPTATYLVYTSEVRALPAAGVVETPRGEWVRLRFEVVEGEAEIAARLGHARGIVLDAGTYGALADDLLRSWRFDGRVLVVYGIDAAQTASELEIDRTQAPPSSDVNAFVLLGGTDAIIGDPARIDRSRPFVGVTYRPPTGGEMDLGTLGWFQDDDEGLRSWMARLAVTSQRATFGADAG